MIGSNEMPPGYSILSDWSPSSGLLNAIRSAFKNSCESMDSSGGKEMMFKLLHCCPCVATCHRAAYCGDLCGPDMNKSAFVLIATCNGLLTVLAKMKATFSTLVQVQRQTFDQICGTSRATARHNLHTHNSSRGRSL